MHGSIEDFSTEELAIAANLFRTDGQWFEQRVLRLIENGQTDDAAYEQTRADDRSKTAEKFRAIVRARQAAAVANLT